MKKLPLFLLLAFLCLSTTTWAQTQPKNYTIKGITVDSTTQKVIPFATIVLIDSMTNVKAVPSEGDGKFSMTHNKAGKYRIAVNYVGYNTISIPIELDMEKVVDLGRIVMQEGLQLEAATVIGKLITTDIDKTTYNTAADPETQVLTALEMMRKVPMLTVDGEENIQLKGQSNFKILVNGKTNTMMSRDYKQVLRSMPASSIKNIEVITNPPAKYDAEGYGGVINIITNRKTNDSYNGSLSIRGDSFGGFGGSGYIASDLGKLKLSANLYGGSYRRPGSESTSYRLNEKDEQYRYMNSGGVGGDSKNSSYSGYIDASYEIDTFNLLTLSFMGYLGNGNSTSNSWTEFRDKNNEISRKYSQISRNKNSYGSISGNIDYQLTFPKPDRSFTVSYRMDYSPNSSNFNTDLTGTLNYDSYNQYSDNVAWGAEHTLQADFYEPITKEHILEAGIKYIMRPNVSNTENYYNNEIDINRRNDLDYLQHIASAYASYQYRKNKFSIKAGLRAEYTVNTGVFKLKEDYPMFNRFFNVVPFATFSYKPTDEQNIRLGYSQRLSRPGIWYLNPYVNDQNPSQISTGNPNLQSAIGHSVDLSWGMYKKSFSINLSTGFNLKNNDVQQVTTIRPDGVMFSTYENIGRELYIGVLNLYGSVNMLDGKLRVYVNAGLAYQMIEMPGTSMYSGKNQGWSGSVSGGISAQPWKNGNVNLYAGFYSPSVSLQYRGSTSFYNNISVSQSFFKRNLTLSIYCNNPFERIRTYSSESFGQGFYQNSSSFSYSRTIGMSLQWRFGKMIEGVKKARRGINNEDKMSGGSSSGGGQ